MVAKIRGQRCGDIELVSYLAHAAGPAPLVLALRIAHERWVSCSNPSLNGQLHYPPPAAIDRSLNETVADKICDYRADYNNRPSNAISFMSDVPSTSGCLNCEVVCILFLQTHRETDPLFCSFRSSA